VKLRLVLAVLAKKNPANAKYTIKSNGDKREDPSIYTGTGGNIVVYWEQYNLYKHLANKEKMTEHLKNTLTAFETNIELADSGKIPSKRLTSPSFYTGLPGLYTMGTLIYKEMGKVEEMKACYGKVIDSMKLCEAKDVNDELLYGTAGYLYCLLKLYMLDKVQFDCKAQIIKATNLLKTQGISSKLKGVLCYTFPKGGKKMYFGAAHGLMGILYILIQAVEVVEELMKDKELLKLIEGSSDYMLTQQYPSGNFKSSLGSENDKLIHFCHGAPGAISFLLSAHKFFKKDQYLKAALKAGEIIWQRGILYKGNGLCHGITGNALPLHTLYRAIGDEKWRYRSRMLIDASWDKEIQEIVKNHDSPGRLAAGVPDTPYSLMEGMGGTAVVYASLMGKEDEVKFPGYEL